MKILFYGAQKLGKDSFNLELPKYPNISIDYIESNLTPMTAGLLRVTALSALLLTLTPQFWTLRFLLALTLSFLLMRCADLMLLDVNAAKDLWHYGYARARLFP